MQEEKEENVPYSKSVSKSSIVTNLAKTLILSKKQSIGKTRQQVKQEYLDLYKKSKKDPKLTKKIKVLNNPDNYEHSNFKKIINLHGSDLIFLFVYLLNYFFLKILFHFAGVQIRYSIELFSKVSTYNLLVLDMINNIVPGIFAKFISSQDQPLKYFVTKMSEIEASDSIGNKLKFIYFFTVLIFILSYFYIRFHNAATNNPLAENIIHNSPKFLVIVYMVRIVYKVFLTHKIDDSFGIGDNLDSEKLKFFQKNNF